MKKFISLKNHEYLISDDEWKSFFVAKKQASEKEESDADVITEVKLKYFFGSSIAKVIIDEFKIIRKKYKLQKGDGYGHSFEIFAVSVLYNIDYDVAFNNYIVSGNFDGKIDAIYWNDDEKNTLYQIKLDYFDSQDYDTMKKNYSEFINRNDIDDKNALDLKRFCEDHKEKINDEKDYEIVIISNNYKTNNITPNEIFYTFFYNKLISRENNVTLSLSIPLYDGKRSIAKNGKGVYSYFANAKTFIDELYKCESIGNKDNLYKYFYDNVRGYLGGNEEICETIINDPSNFIKYNNGVTITGEVTLLKNTPKIKIEKPIINNGQQTICNLVDNYNLIDNISILVIIKDENDDVVKSKISRYTNTQRNIKPLDLLSLNENVRKLQKDLFESESNSFSYFLDINSSGARSYSKLIKKAYGKEKIISLLDFCKLYFCTEDKKLGNWKNNISSMIKPKVYMENEFDIDKAKKVCGIIVEYKKFISNITDSKIKNTLKVADIAFMYIRFVYNYTNEKALELINKINNEYYYLVSDETRKSKLIDLYKSNDIIKKIEDTYNNMN